MEAGNCNTEDVFVMTLTQRVTHGSRPSAELDDRLTRELAELPTTVPFQVTGPGQVRAAPCSSRRRAAAVTARDAPCVLCGVLTWELCWRA